jgi:hypothetical protein
MCSQHVMHAGSAANSVIPSSIKIAVVVSQRAASSPASSEALELLSVCTSVSFHHLMAGVACHGILWSMRMQSEYRTIRSAFQAILNFSRPAFRNGVLNRLQLIMQSEAVLLGRTAATKSFWDYVSTRPRLLGTAQQPRAQACV